MKIKRKKLDSSKITVLLFVLVYIAFTMPIINAYVSAYILMGSVIASTVLIFFQNRYMFKKNLLFSVVMFFYAIIVLFTQIDPNTGVLITIYRLLLTYYPVMLYYYLYNNNMKSELKLISSLYIACLLITMVTTYVGLLLFPDAARYLATVSSSRDDLLMVYYNYNIGGYTLIYTVVLAFPMILYFYKYNIINRYIGLSVITFTFLLLIKSQYTTALLMTIVSVILLVVGKKMTAKKTTIIFISLIISIFAFKDNIAALLIGISELFEYNAISLRIFELGQILSGVQTQGDAAYRTELYNMSISTFLKSPIWGNWGGTIDVGSASGHSTFLDIFATSGIIGASTMFFLLRRWYKSIIAPLKGYPIYGYISWSFILLLVLNSINPGFNGSFLGIVFLVFPGILSNNGNEAK